MKKSFKNKENNYFLTICGKKIKKLCTSKNICELTYPQIMCKIKKNIKNKVKKMYIKLWK